MSHVRGVLSCACRARPSCALARVCVERLEGAHERVCVCVCVGFRGLRAGVAVQLEGDGDVWRSVNVWMDVGPTCKGNRKCGRFLDPFPLVHSCLLSRVRRHWMRFAGLAMPDLRPCSPVFSHVLLYGICG